MVKVRVGFLQESKVYVVEQGEYVSCTCPECGDTHDRPGPYEVKCGRVARVDVDASGEVNYCINGAWFVGNEVFEQTPQGQRRAQAYAVAKNAKEGN